MKNYFLIIPYIYKKSRKKVMMSQRFLYIFAKNIQIIR